MNVNGQQHCSPTKPSSSHVIVATSKKSTRPTFPKRRSTQGASSPRSPLTPTLESPKFKGVKETMAASFLQYCAMCEKQITTPCNSILYCSEACRRKDNNKPLSASYTPPASVPSSPRPIKLNRFSSTTPESSPSSHTSGSIPEVRIPADLHDHKADLDPTEWKPKLPHRVHSEAFRYLSQFHISTNVDNADNIIVRAPVDRSRLTHKSTASMTNTPSLGNTPTTVSSSVDSYDFNTRPLPIRHNPAYSLNAGSMKGIDLVTPHIAPPTDMIVVTPVENAGFNWEKKMVVKSSAKRSTDGLGALFGSVK